MAIATRISLFVCYIFSLRTNKLQHHIHWKITKLIKKPHSWIINKLQWNEMQKGTHGLLLDIQNVNLSLNRIQDATPDFFFFSTCMLATYCLSHPIPCRWSPRNLFLGSLLPCHANEWIGSMEVSRFLNVLSFGSS